MVICITGGIGSGKSRISDAIRQGLGLPVIDSDRVSKSLMAKGTKLYDQVIEIFGEKARLDDGGLNTGYISSVIFGDEAKRKSLNDAVHPATVSKIRELIGAYLDAGFAHVFVESAIPFIAGYKDFCDYFIYVHAPLSDRLKRLAESRGMNEEKAYNIMLSQPSEEEYRSNCDLVIDNGNDTDIKKQKEGLFLSLNELFREECGL